MYLAFQLKIALYTTVDTQVEDSAAEGVNSAICLRRFGLDSELLLRGCGASLCTPSPGGQASSSSQ